MYETSRTLAVKTQVQLNANGRGVYGANLYSWRLIHNGPQRTPAEREEKKDALARSGD